MALALDQCEVPISYCGDSEQSTATVVNNAGTLTVTLSSFDNPACLIRQYDLIQFNGQGPYYEIQNPNDPTTKFIVAPGTGGPWTLTCNVGSLVVPWTANPQTVTYRIFRAGEDGGHGPSIARRHGHRSVRIGDRRRRFVGSADAGRHHDLV